MLLWRMFCSILITKPSYTKLFKLNIYHFFKRGRWTALSWMTECQKMNDRKISNVGHFMCKLFLVNAYLYISSHRTGVTIMEYNASAVKKPFDVTLKPIVYRFKILIWCWFSFSYYSHSKVNRYHQGLMKVRWKEPECRGGNCRPKALQMFFPIWIWRFI